jgi:hypothetical protein
MERLINKNIDSVKPVVVEVLEARMGEGKTTNILKWIDDNYKTERYIYVSPLLSEVEDGGRIHQDLKHAKFHSPESSSVNTKTEHLLDMLKDGLNISCTHSLYTMMDNRHFNLIKSLDYIVVIDEELGVIQSYTGYSSFDLDSLIELGVVTKQPEDGMLLWVKDDPNYDQKNHAYNKFKRLIDNGLVYSSKRKNDMMVLHLPIKLLSVAKRVIILTYLFEGNVLSAFLELKGIEYKPFDDFSVSNSSKQGIRDLITMYEPNHKWKSIEKMKLSSSWYTMTKNGASSKDLLTIQNFISSFSRNTFCDFTDLMYTFPKYRRFDQKNKVVIKPKGLIDREVTKYIDEKEVLEVERVWIAAQTRATNKLNHKTHLVHAFNRYSDLVVKSYLQDYGVKIDEDVFALSELVQWVWRSAIRNGEPITLCILSPRMKKLFLVWLNDDNI